MNLMVKIFKLNSNIIEFIFSKSLLNKIDPRNINGTSKNIKINIFNNNVKSILKEVYIQSDKSDKIHKIISDGNNIYIESHNLGYNLKVYKELIQNRGICLFNKNIIIKVDEDYSIFDSFFILFPLKIYFEKITIDINKEQNIFGFFEHLGIRFNTSALYIEELNFNLRSINSGIVRCLNKVFKLVKLNKVNFTIEIIDELHGSNSSIQENFKSLLEDMFVMKSLIKFNFNLN